MDLEELLRRLIAIDTTAGSSNQAAALFAADYLEHAGCRVDVFEKERANQINVLASVGPPDAQGLMLCGHLDVVPALEPDWTTNPFELTETDSSYAGRGTADMKGFVAVAMRVVAKAAAEPLSHGLSLLLTYDEELGCVGAQDFVEDWDHRRPLPSAAIVGEPTGLRVFRAHKGHLRLRLKVGGVEAHSSCPDAGANAIERAAEVILAIGRTARTWRETPVPDSEIFTDYPHSTASVTTIYGGTASNVIPGSCVLETSIRTLPSERPEAVVNGLESAIRDLPACGGDNVRIDVERFTPALWTDESAPIHREMCGLVGQSESLAAPYTCDAGVLSTMGIECVVFGPGSIRMAHRPNESVPKDDLRRAERVLADLIRLRCR